MNSEGRTAVEKAKLTLSTVGDDFDQKTVSDQNFKENAQAKIEQVGVKIGEYKGKVSENLSTAAGKVHERSDTAQEFLDVKAEKLNEYAHQAIGKANQFGHRAGDALDASSEYVKNFDLAETAKSLKTGFKQRPGTGIALAGVFGLLIGFLVGRSR